MSEVPLYSKSPRRLVRTGGEKSLNVTDLPDVPSYVEGYLAKETAIP